MPSLSIDGREVNVPAGTTVIQAAEELGVFIPRYCYHPALSIAGNCRICLVEVEKFPKLQIACNTFVSEGMVVHTKNEKAEDGRRAVLEFLLANHPLDCPVCDQSGECDLQNFYMNFGLYDPRFREHKVKKKKAVELGPHVMLDQERCILCSRCVRFTDEITKTGEFGIFNRGDRWVIVSKLYHAYCVTGACYRGNINRRQWASGFYGEVAGTDYRCTRIRYLDRLQGLRAITIHITRSPRDHRVANGIGSDVVIAKRCDPLCVTGACYRSNINRCQQPGGLYSEVAGTDYRRSRISHNECLPDF